MKVNHKTFKGGYRFTNFAGQPSGFVKMFKPKSSVAELAMGPEEVRSSAKVLDALGVTAFGGPESALVSTTGNIVSSEVTDIIVSAVEVEPYDLPGDVIVTGENIVGFVDGLKKIHESFAHAKVTLVIGDEQEALQKLLFSTADNLSWLGVATIDSKYPANLKELQIPTILGGRYPVGYDSAHIGVLFMALSDVLTVEQVERGTVYVALAGTGWKENPVLEVPVGTALKDIISQYLGEDEVRLLKNSVITGEVLQEDSVVTYDTKVIIALPEDRRRQTLFFLRPGGKADSFSNSFLSRFMPKTEKPAETNLHGERRVCVSCTYCQSVCPVGLIPHLLHKHVDKDIINERLAEYRIFDCIECGLCDYICPSKVENSSDIKKGKAMLEKNGISHNTYLIPKCRLIREMKEVAANE